MNKKHIINIDIFTSQIYIVKNFNEYFLLKNRD